MRKLVEERTGANSQNQFYTLNPKVDDIPDRRAAALQHRAAHRGADGLYRQRHHARAAFRAASDSSTIFSHNSP